MDVIAAYPDVGSYRGAAEICGTTHKTVKRIIEAHEAGQRPGRKGRPRNFDGVADLVAERVKATPPVMGGEDFSRFYLADKSIQSLIFWVGGVPEAKWQAAAGDPAKLPSLHSPFWAPDAERTISTAAEAMTAAALGVLRKS